MCHKVLVDADLIRVHLDNRVTKEAQEGANQVLSFRHRMRLHWRVVILERQPGFLPSFGCVSIVVAIVIIFQDGKFHFESFNHHC